MKEIEFLFNFCKDSGVKAVDVKWSQDGYIISKYVEAAKLKHISKDTLDKFIEYFGPSVTLKIGALESTFAHIENGKHVTDPKKACENITKVNDHDTLNLSLSLAKSSLLSGVSLNVDLLLFFCKILGIGESYAKSKDTYLSTYNLIKKDIAAGNIKKIYIFILDALLEAFGKALLLEIKLRGAQVLLRIFGGNSSDLEKNLKQIDGFSDTEKMEITLNVNKSILLGKQGLDEAQCHSMLFLFKNSLTGFLKNPLPELDNKLFTAPFKPTIILVLDTDIYYSGQFLTITGMKYLEEAREELSPIDPYIEKAVKIYRQVANDRLNWNGFADFKNITPRHFMCTHKGGNDDEIGAVITAQLLHLLILYTANLSSYNEKKFESSYISTDHTVKFALMLEGTVIKKEEKGLLEWLAKWPFLDKATKQSDNDNKTEQTDDDKEDEQQYSDKITERIIIFQTVITRNFQNKNSEPSDNYYSFVERLKELKNEVIWHYRAFIEGQIDKHFEQVQKITDDVADVAKEVSQRFDTVTKGFIETLMATIGVIVLTLVASLIKKEAQGEIFKIGMWVYASYLFIFHVLYRMSSILHSYCYLNLGTNERLEVCKVKLGKEKIKELLSPLKRRRTQFLWWFWATIVIYIAIIIGLFILGEYLPSYLEELNSANSIGSYLNTSRLY